MTKILIGLCLCLLSSIGLAQICEDSHRFEDNGNIINDTKTGLIWKKCAIGKTSNECNGIAKKYTWEQALNVVKTEIKKTQKNWRFPTIQELRIIVNENCNNAFFHNINLSDYWSAEKNEDGSYSKKNIYFVFGSREVFSTSRYVLMVRDR